MAERLQEGSTIRRRDPGVALESCDLMVFVDVVARSIDAHIRIDRGLGEATFAVAADVCNPFKGAGDGPVATSDGLWERGAKVGGKNRNVEQQ